MGDNTRFRLDAAQSHFTVQAFAEGLFSAFAHDPVIAVQEFTGDVQCELESMANASVTLTIKAGSLVVSDSTKESDRAEIEHKMRDEVLETDKYPEIIFVSSNVTATKLTNGQFRARMIGDLTLHGATQKNLWLFAEVSINENGLRAQGEYALKQTDFGIKLVSVAIGALKVKNEVKLTFDIAATKV